MRTLPVDLPPVSRVARAAAPPLVEQVVSVVKPLSQLGDGVHEVTLELRPADLGSVRVEVRVEHGTVHATLRVDDDQTATLLRHSMPELRSSFAEAGLLGSATIDLSTAWTGGNDAGQGRDHTGRPGESDHRHATARPETDPRADAGRRPPAAQSAGSLDLLL